MCAVVFEELNAALNLLETVRNEFNPIQRMLVGRFLTGCKVFGHEMLLADGNSDELITALGLFAPKNTVEKNQLLKPEGNLISTLCTEICSDLDRIGQTIQSELLTGIIETIESIIASHDLDNYETDTLYSIVSSVRHLAEQVASLFEVQPYSLQRQYAAYQSNVNKVDDSDDETRRVTAEEFMQTVKPPERKATLRDRLQPFIPELKRLRQDGYTYAQCAQFLEQNDIKTYAGAISSIMNDFRYTNDS